MAVGFQQITWDQSGRHRPIIGSFLRFVEHFRETPKRTNGAPRETRTPDLRFRKPLLCPAELPGHDVIDMARVIAGQ